MKKVLGFRLEKGETLCDIIRDHRDLGVHLMLHQELPGNVHIFEEREEQFVDLPVAKITPLEMSRWDEAARTCNNRKRFYVMRGSVDPAVDIYPFPPVVTFTVGGEKITAKIAHSSSNGTGDCIQLYHQGELVAASGGTMNSWTLRRWGFHPFADVLDMAKAVMTVIKFLDEKLYDH